MNYNPYKRFLSFTIIVLFTGCDKGYFDYRNKYEGNWKFTYTKRECPIGPYPCVLTEGEYSGKISHDNDREQPHAITVYFTSNPPLVVLDVDRKGKLTGCSADGEFESKDKVSFTYGCGKTTTFTVTGIKQ